MPMPTPRVLALLLLLPGCAGRNALPPELMDEALVHGIGGIRAFGGRPSETFKQDFLGLLEREAGTSPAAPRSYPVLAISGGSSNGAYGAGLLCGWTRSGKRPEFKVVTGISTGAIIAPLAFLGGACDGLLEEFYTEYSTRDLMRVRYSPIEILFRSSFASVRPLEVLIERFFDAQFMRRVAAEHAKGRRLYLGTTNLDAQRLVVWDMGRIAAVGDERALKLFRKIIVASVSIPVAFPPVYMKATANGRRYDEMHVDGGITRQVFFLYDVLQGLFEAVKERGLDPSAVRYEIYVIRNGYLDPIFKEVPESLSAIAARTIETMINSQNIGDLYQLYFFTRDRGGAFHLAHIPASHVCRREELFDPAEMRRLFDLGFAEALGGYPWKESPPGLEAAGAQEAGADDRLQRTPFPPAPASVEGAPRI